MGEEQEFESSKGGTLTTFEHKPAVIDEAVEGKQTS